MKLFVQLTAALSLATFAGEIVAETIYSRQKDVLIDAIQNAQASGLMEGELSELFAAQFRSNGPLLVTAKVVQTFADPSCKRIELVYRKKDVHSASGLTDAVVKGRVNYCLDGRPPMGME